MTPSYFNALFYEDKLLLVAPRAPKVATFIIAEVPASYRKGHKGKNSNDC